MSKLQQLMGRIPGDLDAVLLCSTCNRLYYTGMESSAGTLFVCRDKARFIIDFRYIEAARRQVTDCQVVLQEKLGEQLRALAGEWGAKRIGIESGYCTVQEYLKFCEMLPGCELVMDNRVNEAIAAQRMIKEERELSRIRRAQALTDQSFEYICGFIQPGLTEREIALELEFYSRKIGSEGASFEFIVVSGPNSSLPHGVPGDRRVQRGDFVTMDFGCIIEGYHSDMTRTVAVGRPSAEMEEVYGLVLKANLDAMAAIRAGVPCREVDKVARDIIAGAGYADNFGHGLGHSVGVEIHEEPRFSPTAAAQTLCQPGMVMTVEPGIYLPGRFGCRIEDMVAVTENGCINLTQSPKDLRIL